MKSKFLWGTLSLAVFGVCFSTKSNFENSEDLKLRQASSGLLLISGRVMMPERIKEDNFPYVDGGHPQDYQLLDAPIDPEFIVEDLMVLRVSWKVENNATSFIPMSFILEPRLPAGFYFSDIAYRILSKNRRIFQIEDNFYETCSVNRGTDSVLMAALQSPIGFENANFIGKNAMLKFGLIMGEPPGGFRFRSNISWFLRRNSGGNKLATDSSNRSPWVRTAASASASL